MPERAHAAEMARVGLWPAILQAGPLGALSPPRPSGMGRGPPPREHELRFENLSFARAGLAAPRGFLGPDGFNRARGQMASRARFATNTKTEGDNTMSNLPAHKIKIGLVTATIWNNDGFYSVDLSRSYKNGRSEEHTS